MDNALVNFRAVTYLLPLRRPPSLLAVPCLFAASADVLNLGPRLDLVGVKVVLEVFRQFTLKR